MTKLTPIFINREKWIQLSQLTGEQSRLLKFSLPVNCLKKINFQGIEFSDCLDFEIYEYWLHYRQVVQQKQAMIDF